MMFNRVFNQFLHRKSKFRMTHHFSIVNRDVNNSIRRDTCLFNTVLNHLWKTGNHCLIFTEYTINKPDFMSLIHDVFRRTNNIGQFCRSLI
ncbi:hypothetical protein A6E15_17875 [Natrinema saccharevitans]|uniref:Uncharacterized protein n=1 Tax=Natrinema saccharevitans TaxID=301967 RepID=A0A1S8AR43_9EURY|nr:hypothetical protein A6E15_17875 [Natrinema saccharevitans]